MSSHPLAWGCLRVPLRAGLQPATTPGSAAVSSADPVWPPRVLQHLPAACPLTGEKPAPACFQTPPPGTLALASLTMPSRRDENLHREARTNGWTSTARTRTQGSQNDNVMNTRETTTIPPHPTHPLTPGKRPGSGISGKRLPNLRRDAHNSRPWGPTRLPDTREPVRLVVQRCRGAPWRRVATCGSGLEHRRAG